LPADRRDSRAQPRRYREHDVTALGQVLIATSVLACGIIYGTDVFPAIVPRPALALADDPTLVSIRGRVHDFGDRRLRAPGVAGLAAVTLGTAVVAWAGHLAATVADAIAVAALACWLIIYARISAPINSRVPARADRRGHPRGPRRRPSLQTHWRPKAQAEPPAGRHGAPHV